MVASPLLASMAFSLASLVSSTALALDDDREGTPRSAAPDQLAGELLVRAGVEVVGPVGSIATDVAADDLTASGVGFGASLGLGVSRQAELVLSGGFATLQDPSRCSPCGGDTARVGLGLAYHLAQGVAIDPWARWGLGFRTTAVDDAGATNRVAQEAVSGRYHGIDLTQLALGAMWSPTGGFGLGPYVEMDLGTYVARPDGAGSGAMYAFFTAGFALQLAPTRFGAGPGAGATPATAPSSAASAGDTSSRRSRSGGPPSF